VLTSVGSALLGLGPGQSISWSENGLDRRLVVLEVLSPFGTGELIAAPIFGHMCLYGERAMARTFKVGDHVTWSSEAGHVSGRIVKVHKKNVSYKGYIHHASKEDPQYAIRSDKTDHIALHKATALKLLRR
jgi:hypothetical protein